MPEIIDLKLSDILCPFTSIHSDRYLRQIIYFARRLELETDEEGDNIKEEYICTSCGFTCKFYSRKRISEMEEEVDNHTAPVRQELYDVKEKLRDSRKNQFRLRTERKSTVRESDI